MLNKSRWIFMRRTIIWIGIFVLLSGLLIFYFVSKPNLGATYQEAKNSAANVSAQAHPEVSAPALTVTFTYPELRAWSGIVDATGSITPWQEIIVSTEIEKARIMSVLAEVGDKVKRGQLLAKIDNAAISSDVEQAKAALAEAQSVEFEADQNAKRATSLADKGFYSAQSLLQYQTASTSASARSQSAKARLDNAQLKLSHTEILAPDDGLISARMATVGSLTQPGQELFRLIRKGRMEWRAELIGDDLIKIKKGTPVEMQAADGSLLRSRVRSISPSVNAASRIGIAYVDIPACSIFRAGMFARGKLEFSSYSALSLPQSAALQRDGFTFVFVLMPATQNQNGGMVEQKLQKIEQRKVSVGQWKDGRVEILAGLEPSTPVVESGGALLTNGDFVRVIYPDKSKAAKAIPVPAQSAPTSKMGCFPALPENKLQANVTEGHKQ